MPILAGDILRVTATWRFNSSSDIQNAFIMEIEDPGTVEDEGVLEAIQNYIERCYSNITPFLTALYVLSDLDIFNLSTGQPLGSIPPANNLIGSSNSNSMPPAAAVLSYARTGLSRRVGRKFWPGSHEDVQLAGVWTPATVIAYSAAAQDWIDDFTDVVTNTVIRPGVTSIVNGLSSSFVPFLNTVTSALVSNVRTRKVGVGS